VRTALAVRRDLDSNGSLALLSRHEGRFARDYIGSLRMLADLRSCPPAPPAAITELSADTLLDGASPLQLAEQNDANPISGQQERICRFVKPDSDETVARETIVVTAGSFEWPTTSL
jgi:hypothetical protein